MRNLSFGAYRFSPVCFYCSQTSVDVIGFQIDQHSIELMHTTHPRLDETPAGSTLGLELRIIEGLISLSFPAKNIAIKLACRARVNSGNLNMYDWMTCHK